MAAEIRHSSIAGTWYPGTERALRSTLQSYFELVKQPPVPGKLMALLSPHAGYAYSGQTAAHAYQQLKGLDIDTIVILGPSHRAWVGDYAVSTEDAYETPLGRVPLDQALVAKLGRQVNLNPIRHDAEHSLEIQLPFLQYVLGQFRLVPIMMSASSPNAAQQLAAGLARVISSAATSGQRVVMVASSDLHHIDNYDQVVERDEAVVEAIAAYDIEALTPLLTAADCSVCGRMPILTVLYAAQQLGADSVQVLHQTNSGDITGQRHPGQYTVGYMSAAIYESQGPPERL
jgi:AmmeMemoRadiSam system protein B